MKIEYSKYRLNKDFITHKENSEVKVFSRFVKLSIEHDSPVWKNKVIIESQMEGTQSEESSEVSDKPQEESKESQNEPQEVEVSKEKETQQPTEWESQTKSVTSQTDPESLDEPLKQDEQPVKIQPLPPPPQFEHKSRIVVKHNILGNRIPSHDQNVLVETTTFSSVGKIQPFLITMSTNAALIMDYHCHLTTSEVVGYLAGSWDVNSHNLNVTHAFPCKCRLGDYESAPIIEAEIRKTIKSSGLTVVGWYHSHPTAPATPSLRDIRTQLDYELRMKGANDSTYLPCIGVICSPYNLDNPSFESNIVGYWVIPPPENKIHEYGKPMMMTYGVFQDQSIPHDILLEMKKCADFYKPEKDYIKFLEVFKGQGTFLEKMKVSVSSKFPLNHQKGEALWNFLQDITLTSTDKTETEILKQIIDISRTPSATPPPSEKPKFNIPTVPPPLTPMSFKSAANNSSTVGSGAITTTTTTSSSSSSSCSNTGIQYHKSHSRPKSSGKRSSSRDNKNLASLSNYFVGSDLAALFGSGKFPSIGLDPATKSLLNLNSLSLGGMFLPPMAAAAAAAAATYKSDPSIGLMKPPPPPSSYYSNSSSRNSSNSRSGTSTTSRTQSRSIPSTSRDMPPPTKVPKLDVHQMANFFIPPNLGKNCTITNRPSTSTSSK